MSSLYPRLVTARAREILQDTPALLIQGPRQCGKSTLAALLVPEANRVTLDDIQTRSGAETDPAGFLERLPSPALIDEVQRIPALMLALKASIDRDRRPGRFVLTGSAQVLSVEGVEDSLAGRLEQLDLSPLTQLEFERRTRDPVSDLFAGDFTVQTLAPLEPLELSTLERLHRGGFPEAAQRMSTRRSRWFADYSSRLLDRDVLELGRVEHRAALPRLLRQLAASSATLLNATDLARTLALNAVTFRRYLELLELVFLTVRLPAWSSNRLKRPAKMPKLHLCDTGLASALLNLNAQGLERDRLKGPLFESFVTLEILRLLASSATQALPYHLRTHEGVEVDLILERSDLRLVGLEVKASSNVTSADFRHLRTLREAEPERFVGGYVFYEGTQILPFGPQFWALPIRWLWSA